jgi:serine/threonine-protein kinase
MAQLAIDRFAALAVRRGYITRAQLEGALRELGLRASTDRAKLVEHLVAKGALTRPQVAELELFLKRRDLYCPGCHSVWLIEDYDPQEDYACRRCGAALRRPDGMDLQSRYRVEDIFREIGPEEGDGASGTRRSSSIRFGRYKLVKMLGRGSMGEVFLALDEKLDRHVALKIVPRDMLRDEDLMRRFTREARALAKIQHPNVVQVYDVDDVKGRPYMVMEFVDGPNLDHVIRTAGRIAPRPFAKIAHDACCGLAHAHRAGFVHRDVKPGNILLTQGGMAKLSDFGLVYESRHGETTTLTGMLLGTPYYISPEAAEGRRADIRSDVYSLGVTFYHMLAGRRPFEGGGALTIALKHIECTAPSMPRDVPKGLAALVERMIQKRPQDRPQTVAEVAKELRPFLES